MSWWTLKNIHIFLLSGQCTKILYFSISVGTASGGVSGSSATGVLVPGDVVEVVEGDLMNLQGKVVSVEGDTVTIIPHHEDLKVG